MRQINLRLDEELLARVDAARGMVPREAWLRLAVEQMLANVALDRVSGPSPVQAASQSSHRSYRGQPGPNVESVRSHAQAKRGVGPVPKGKG